MVLKVRFESRIGIGLGRLIPFSHRVGVSPGLHLLCHSLKVLWELRLYLSLQVKWVG